MDDVISAHNGPYAHGNITSAGWQVILCDPIWHVSSRSGEASCELLYSVYLYLYLLHVETAAASDVIASSYAYQRLAACVVLDIRCVLDGESRD